MIKWKIEQAITFCDDIKDGTHDSPRHVSNGYKLLTSKHITNGVIDTKTAKTISPIDYETINKRSKVDVNDILFSMIGTIGSVCRIASEPNFAIKNMGLFKVSDEIRSKYLYYYLQSPTAKEYIASATSGSTQQYISLGSLRKFPIKYPSQQSDMQRMVEILDSLQKKITLNNRINDYLAETAVALFNRECSQSNEPNAMLSDIAQITMGQSPSGSSYNEEGDGEVFYQGRAEFGAFFPRRRLFTTKPKRMAQEGDTLMSVRAPVGDLNIANENCCIGRGLAAIHSENNQSFVHYLVRAQRRILNTFNGDGTVFGSINGKALKELPVFLPGNDVIAHLESQLKSIDELIRRNDDEMQALEQMRDTLLPRLMSGEIDVSQIEVPKQLNNHLCDYS